MPDTPDSPAPPTRWIGLDIHKEYFVAAAVDANKKTVMEPARVENINLKSWMNKTLSKSDAVVMEMTTNTYLMHDALLPLVHSVTVVHPPHVALITRAQVKTDRKAAVGLAQLHAAGLLVGIWIPPRPIRELRALVAQRWKMVRMATVAKNRLHNALHRHHLEAPDTAVPFSIKQKEFWLSLPVEGIEKMNVETDWETVEFAERQKKRCEEQMAKAMANDSRLALLVQITGFGLITSTSLLAAIGDISRFETAKQLVGYAGLGAAVHDSGKHHSTGRITKAGRRDLRFALVEAAHVASRHHPRWKKEFARLAPRIGKGKAYVAIARKLLIVVWHVLSGQTGDTHADPTQVAVALYQFFHKNKLRNHLSGIKAMQFVRQGLDSIGMGDKIETMPTTANATKYRLLCPHRLPGRVWLFGGGGWRSLPRKKKLRGLLWRANSLSIPCPRDGSPKILPTKDLA